MKANYSSKPKVLQNQNNGSQLYNYYIPHEYKEAFPYRLYGKLFERKDGYDVYACVRNVWFWNVRGGIGIIFKL